MYNYDLLNMGVDPDDCYDPPTRHCPGPAIEQSHGCGRWVSRAGDMCSRCDAESTQWHAEQIAEARRDREYLEQRIAELDTQSDACGTLLSGEFIPFSDADMPTRDEQIAENKRWWAARYPELIDRIDFDLDKDLPF